MVSRFAGQKDTGAFNWPGSTSLGIALLLVAVIAGGPLSAQAPDLGGSGQINECNGDITINTGMIVGTTLPVTLEIENGPSNDAADNPVAATFDPINYWGSCSSTGPCVPAAGVTFIDGSETTTCPGTFDGTAAPSGAGEVVTFNFGPSGLVLGPAATSQGLTTCTISFDVMVPAPGPTQQTFLSEAGTDVVCAVTGLQISSSDSVAIIIDPAVPTVGEVGLAVLALILLGGSLVMIRRRGGVSTSP